MKRTGTIIVLCIVIIVSIIFYTHMKASKTKTSGIPAQTLKLTSPAFAAGGMIPGLYTCTGKNISPPLSISGVPEKTVSFALIVDDPDAPVGVWDHWIIFNIDKDTREIPEGQPPHGTPGKGSSGDLVYMGPCPPSGVHRYMFTLYALDAMLPTASGATKQDVIAHMNGHILAQAVLVGKYAK